MSALRTIAQVRGTGPGPWLALSALLALGGCASLPAAAPTSGQVTKTATKDTGEHIAIVRLDDAAVAALNSAPPPSLPTVFSSSVSPGDLRIGAGDVLQISIWETGPAGLFTQTTVPPQQGGRSASLQLVAVGHDGYITLPFAGRVLAAGLTADQLGASIEKLLMPLINAPGVMVYVASNNANDVTVGGDVNHAAVFPMSMRGDRVLDAIAAAGGSKWPVYDTYVRMQRGGRGVRVPLQTIVDSPAANILLQPGDDLFLYRQTRSFEGFGAMGHVGQYTFDQPQLSLMEALSRAGGLVDTESNPTGVYLFREVSPEVAARLGVATPASGQTYVRVLLKVDMTQAGSFFRAQKLVMQDRDVVLVTNADMTQDSKVLAFLRNFTGAYGELTRRPD